MFPDMFSSEKRKEQLALVHEISRFCDHSLKAWSGNMIKRYAKLNLSRNFSNRCEISTYLTKDPK